MRLVMNGPATFLPKKQAQKRFLSYVTWAMFALIIPLMLVRIVLGEWLNRNGIHTGALGGTMVFFSSIYLAKIWGRRRLRQEGLLLQVLNRGTIRRTAMEFSGSPREWSQPKENPGFMGWILYFVFMTAALWWEWSMGDGFVLLLAPLLIVFALFVGSISLSRRGKADISVNSEGVAFWPRLCPCQKALWAAVAECEITRAFDNLDREPVRLFSFKGNDGTVLSRMELRTQPWLSDTDIDEIEAEIKRRMTG